MSRLVDSQIEKMGLDGVIEPYNPEHLNPASIDVILGDRIRVELPSDGIIKQLLCRLFGLPYRSKPGWEYISIVGYTKENPYWIDPKELFLAATFEKFHLPPSVTVEFRLKSSRGREGWGHCLACFGDPGWNNSVLTLELVNECRYHRLPIYPGLRIGQMVFDQCAAMPRKTYAETGRYNGDLTVMESKG